jgi:hypothetical protein
MIKYELRKILDEVFSLRGELRMGFEAMSAQEDAALAAATTKMVADLATLLTTQQTAMNVLLAAISASGGTSDPVVAQAVSDIGVADQKVNDAIAAANAIITPPAKPAAHGAMPVGPLVPVMTADSPPVPVLDTMTGNAVSSDTNGDKWTTNAAGQTVPSPASHA